MKRTFDFPVFPAFRENENGLFAAITSPREGVFCYPVKGRRMAADMIADLLAEDFVCVGEDDNAKVIDFARLPEAPVLKLA